MAASVTGSGATATLYAGSKCRTDSTGLILAGGTLTGGFMAGPVEGLTVRRG